MFFKESAARLCTALSFAVYLVYLMEDGEKHSTSLLCFFVMKRMQFGHFTAEPAAVYNDVGVKSPFDPKWVKQRLVKMKNRKQEGTG